MNLNSIQLNPEQKLAVDTLNGALLIIAGAGSGKTGVITSRIANMLAHGIPQSNILALTFTNKAASEMEERVRKITGKKLTNLTLSTFHAFGVKVLREHYKEMGFRPNFSIYDTNDKISCLKEAARELKLKYEYPELMELGNLFSSIKTERLAWDNSNDQHKPLYLEYEDHMRIYNAVDFDDLIVKPIRLLEKSPDILDKYQEKFRYIMVDEFQDTSTIQYKMLQLLSSKYRNICCVGDDDQSIYSWRGANFGNILQFETDFPELMEIKLERNYRSTGTILKAANAVIANNANRKLKELWTELSHNEMTIKHCLPEDDRVEAEFIASTIASLRMQDHMKYDQFGILIRTNSLSKAIEDALLNHNIPYSMSGGTSFFQRAEIRDIIAYFRVINNPDDDVNLMRIINTPRRGVGKKALETLVNLAQDRGESMYSSLTALLFAADSGISSQLRGGLADFMEIIEDFKERFTESKALAATAQELVEEIGYWDFLLHEHSNNDKVAKWKYDNVVLFIEFMSRWEKNPDNLNPSLQKWLNRITLVTRDEMDEEDAGKVNLMTIHASKGLEFDVVFLAGVERDIIPHARAIAEDPKNMEEERRLFYVAITRARKKLFITSCLKRKQMREMIDSGPSPFLLEIPIELMDEMVMEVEVEDADEAKKYFARLPWK
ncbi:ATP-dependent helicase [Oceanispirochaeta sp.]|jgi:DNA helicase-2/ATP-dependent DNA helicase PcrA|uniref:ATP-dependent helicase n=1 Tax=Oceanispirochaeta sp. TaxID=2035350 RepID=UPI00262293B2|nr:UvrD-helicase domain-containing protein [Oceanispirochaeta sp.]MDA3958823.1 UvrD-helicase domain-containing protein [Oceanispirochaeta sp.]